MHPRESYLDAACAVMAPNLVEFVIADFDLVRPACSVAAVVLLNAHTRRAPQSLLVLEAVARLNVMRTPMAVTMHSHLVRAPTVHSPALTGLDFDRGLDSFLMAVILQCYTETFALGAPAVERLDAGGAVHK